MTKPTRRPRPGVWTRKDRGLAGSSLSFEGSGQSDLAAWRDGVGLALIPALFGLWTLITGHFAMNFRSTHILLDSALARVLGIAALALGACVHFHFFWGAHDRLSPYSQPAQAVAALVFFGALSFIAYAALG